MRKLVVILSMMLAWTAYAQTTEKTWFLVTDKGDAVKLSMVSYLMAASTETFDIVCTDGTTVSGVSSISLEEREETGIKTQKMGMAMFSQIVDDQITISHAKAGTTVQVLSLSGVTLCSQNLKEGANIINVSTLQSGTYILKVGDTNIKFIKR